ncbi:IS110 family transposase [Aquimarina sp. M1]
MLQRNIPGIGPIVASGILSELGNLRRFRCIKHLAGYVGLCPCIYQSGDAIRHTGVSMSAHHWRY